MALCVIHRKDKAEGVLQISGVIERPDGSKVRIRRAPRSRDPITALMEARDLERRLMGLMPLVDVLRAKLETIVLLTESRNASALSQIARIAVEAIALLPHDPAGGGQPEG
jgi:hypothetical protein